MSDAFPSFVGLVTTFLWCKPTLYKIFFWFFYNWFVIFYVSAIPFFSVLLTTLWVFSWILRISLIYSVTSYLKTIQRRSLFYNFRNGSGRFHKKSFYFLIISIRFWRLHLVKCLETLHSNHSFEILDLQLPPAETEHKSDWSEHISVHPVSFHLIFSEKYSIAW